MEQKNIVLINVTLSIKNGKFWHNKIIYNIVSRGNNKQEIINNIKAGSLKITKEYKIKSIEVIKVVGLTNYKE